MPSQFPDQIRSPDAPEQSAAEYSNHVSLGVVAHDPEDPSLAFVRIENGQVLVEVELAGDGDAVNAYLCHSTTGASAGDYIPVEPGESVVIVWPDALGSPYIIARLADVERSLAGSAGSIATTGAAGLRSIAGGGTAVNFPVAPCRAAKALSMVYDHTFASRGEKRKRIRLPSSTSGQGTRPSRRTRVL